MSNQSATDDILIRRDGRAGRITMNRPQVLNALTHTMVGEITKALETWRTDPAIELVLLDGAGDRGLCAGGDVRWLYDRATDKTGIVRRFFREEYTLNAAIGRYPKPFVALQDGLVMGGGIGLSGHARHRIVTERSALAMPETLIGLVPDVGGTWILAHAPGETGVYLALIGARMNFVDAIYSGFADAYMPVENLAPFGEELCRKTGEPAWRILESWQETVVGASPLQAHREEIDSCFGFDSIEAIEQALSKTPGEWAARTLSDIGKRSPKALKATLKAVRDARALPSLEAALDVEYRLVTRLYEDGEFIEGVRAAIVDKDRRPKWRPATLGEVGSEMIAALFAPLPAGEELGLAKALG